MIRVLIVDDHPTMRAGVWAVLRAEPGLQPVGAADTIGAAIEEARAAPCDVVLVDYRLGSHNGLHLCRRLKAAGDMPRVLVYSGYPEADLWIPARLAGADGVLSKSALPEAVVESIRIVAAGGAFFPELERERIVETANRLDPEDLPVLGMAIEGTPVAEIAYTLQVGRREIEDRLYRMIDRLDFAADQPELRV